MAATNEVAAWLASFQMDKYAHAIVVENGCDTMESVLEDLDEEALEGMGVKPFHRKRILRKIAALGGGGGQGQAAGIGLAQRLAVEALEL